MCESVSVFACMHVHIVYVCVRVCVYISACLNVCIRMLVRACQRETSVVLIRVVVSCRRLLMVQIVVRLRALRCVVSAVMILPDDSAAAARVFFCVWDV